MARRDTQPPRHGHGSQGFKTDERRDGGQARPDDAIHAEKPGAGQRRRGWGGEHGQHRGADRDSAQRRVAAGHGPDQGRAESPVDRDRADVDRHQSEGGGGRAPHPPPDRNVRSGDVQQRPPQRLSCPARGSTASRRAATTDPPDRGDRRIVPASKAAERTGSTTVWRDAMCNGPSGGGGPNASGKRASPATGTCTASTWPMASRRVSKMCRPGRIVRTIEPDEISSSGTTAAASRATSVPRTTPCSRFDAARDAAGFHVPPSPRPARESRRP